MPPANYLLTVELSSELYAALQNKAQVTGQTESELVIQGLQQILDLPDSSPIPQPKSQDAEQERFALLEIALEARLKEYVEKLISDRLPLASPPLIEEASNSPLDIDSRNIDTKSPMPMPTIRPLQVGDRVLVLEPDSPYYMAKLLVIKTSLIRATVETETGEKTFLKRDLRFVEATQESK
jgi:hypothetical protein